MGDSAQQGQELLEAPLCSTGASHPPLSPWEPLSVPALTPQGCWDFSHFSPPKFSCLPWDGSGPRGQQRRGHGLSPQLFTPAQPWGSLSTGNCRTRRSQSSCPKPSPTELHLPARSQVESGLVLHFPHTSVCIRAFLRAGTRGKWGHGA